MWGGGTHETMQRVKARVVLGGCVCGGACGCDWVRAVSFPLTPLFPPCAPPFFLPQLAQLDALPPAFVLCAPLHPMPLRHPPPSYSCHRWPSWIPR